MKRAGVLLGLAAVVAASAFFLFPADENLASVKISVPDMMCENCVEHVQKALSQVDGVENLEVSLEAKAASVTYDPAKTDASALQAAIRAAGYGNANVEKDCGEKAKDMQSGECGDMDTGCCDQDKTQSKT